MKASDLSEKFCKMLQDTTTSKKELISIDDVRKLLTTCDNISNLNYMTMSYKEVLLSEIKVPAYLLAFLKPRKVSFNVGDIRYPDLIDHDLEQGVESKGCASIEEFVRLANKISLIMKVQPVGVSIMEAVAPKDFSTVISRLSEVDPKLNDKGEIVGIDEVYTAFEYDYKNIPITINDISSFVGDEQYIRTFEVDRFLAYVVNSVRTPNTQSNMTKED